MRGTTVLITGANGGIGRATTAALARRGATIVMGCRNVTKTLPVCEAIRRESGNPQIEVLRLDLASLASVRGFAEAFGQRYGRLDVLVNNAGVFCPRREETADGFERTIGINYLGPFLLTHLLLDTLNDAPAARVVNVSSEAAFYGRLRLDDLHMTRRYHGFRAYAASKQAIVLSTRELARRLVGKRTTINALHPGHVATGIWPNQGVIWRLFEVLQRRFTVTPQEGARTSVYLACAEEVRGVSAEFYADMRSKAVPPNCRDPELQRALWRVSAQQTGLA
jgi:NAD(P)-dependent dehydrogenase (short-subunit alcohol dehydrogenase family)